MNITAAQVKEIGLELARMKPAKVTLDGNRSLTVKETIFALAPTLERMKKRSRRLPTGGRMCREKC